MKHQLLFLSVLLAPAAVFSSPESYPVKRNPPPIANSSSNSVNEGGNLYILPAPVSAAPIYPGLCSQGKSFSWSIGWNFFSYATSQNEYDVDCLEKYLAITPKATEREKAVIFITNAPSSGGAETINIPTSSCTSTPANKSAAGAKTGCASKGK